MGKIERKQDGPRAPVAAEKTGVMVQCQGLLLILFRGTRQCHCYWQGEGSGGPAGGPRLRLRQMLVLQRLARASNQHGGDTGFNY